MKKLTLSLALILTAALASADIPGRTFEVGTDLEVGLGNSYFTLRDLTQEVLVIDLNQIAATLSEDGLAFSADQKVTEFVNLNLSPDLRMGLFFQVQSAGYSSIPKAFFELAAQGNGLDQEYSGTMKLRGDLTAELGASYGTRVFGFDLKVGTSYYMPLVHLENPKASYTWRTGSDGTMVADVSADIPVYSVVPLDGEISPSAILGNMFRSGGLDFTVAAEYPLFSDLLLVGGELKNIPLWPARLEDRTRLQSSFRFTMADAVNNFDDQENLYRTTQNSTFVSDKAPIAVLRPFKLNLHATYQPLGTPLISLTPDLGLGVYGWVYPEFGLTAKLDVWRWLVLELATRYQDQLWKQKASLGVNLWLIELDAGIASQSQDIGKSFGAGLSASVGFRMGF